MHALSHGETWVPVCDVNAVGDCCGNLLVAEGRGTFEHNDNDAFGSADPRASTWILHGKGRLEETYRKAVHDNGVAPLQFGPHIEFRVLKSEVNLN